MWKPIYAQLAEMRDWLRLRDIEDTDDDALLRLKLSAASRAVDATCRRQFGKVDVAVTRSYPLRWSKTYACYVAEIDDLMDLTGLAVDIDGQALTTAQYKLRPRNALADGKPYTWIEVRNVSLGGVGSWAALRFGPTLPPPDLNMLAPWGWIPTWPDVAKEATMLQASRLNIRRDSPYGIAGGADGGTLRLLARLDPDIAPLVVDYVRTGWTAR